jgi:hypothetical protein
MKKARPCTDQQWDIRHYNVILARVATSRELWHEAGGNLLLVGHGSVVVKHHVHLLRMLPAT